MGLFLSGMQEIWGYSKNKKKNKKKQKKKTLLYSKTNMVYACTCKTVEFLL